MSTIKIDKRVIGDGCKPFIIAEAGINHNGNMELAKKMVLAAKDAGADAVKFQTFHAKDFIQDRTLMYTYKSQGKKITEPIIDVFERSEFNEEQWKELKIYCDLENILFLSTPGNISDLELLMSLGTKAIKVGSDDFINIPLIRQYAKEQVPLILSCGMATENEIDLSIKTAEREGKELALLLCTSQYPTPPKDVNILKLKKLRSKYPEVVIGLSDHTIGSTAAIMAVACGASIFEKHFTLDKNFPGPDHWFSEDIKGLQKWIKDIREAYIMLGTSELQPTSMEKVIRNEAHRSITTLCEIEQGEVFTENNLCMKRPGTGLSGCYWDEVIGKVAKKKLLKGTQIRIDDIK